MTIIDINTANIQHSPFLKTLIASGIGYDQDENGNIIFNEFPEVEVVNYITYLNTGICNIENFNPALYDYMGHEYARLYDEDVEFMKIKLEEEWLCNNKKKLSTIDTYMVIDRSIDKRDEIQDYLEGWNYIIVKKIPRYLEIYIKADNIDSLLDRLRESKYIIKDKDDKYYINLSDYPNAFSPYHIIVVDNHIDILYSYVNENIHNPCPYISGVIYGDNIYKTKKRSYEIENRIIWLESDMRHYNTLYYMRYVHKFPHFEEWFEENDRLILELARNHEIILNRHSVKILFEELNTVGSKYHSETIQTILNMYNILRKSGGTLDIRVNFPSYFLLMSLGFECKYYPVEKYETMDKMLESIKF